MRTSLIIDLKLNRQQVYYVIHICYTFRNTIGLYFDNILYLGHFTMI